MLMKNNVHGGRNAMLQTVSGLQQFTRHLLISPKPVPGQKNLLFYNSANSLFIDIKGRLQIINTDYQNN